MDNESAKNFNALVSYINKEHCSDCGLDIYDTTGHIIGYVYIWAKAVKIRLFFHTFILKECAEIEWESPILKWKNNFTRFEVEARPPKWKYEQFCKWEE